jgi:hypothetical protein
MHSFISKLAALNINPIYSALKCFQQKIEICFLFLHLQELPFYILLELSLNEIHHRLIYLVFFRMNLMIFLQFIHQHLFKQGPFSNKVISNKIADFNDSRACLKTDLVVNFQT